MNPWARGVRAVRRNPAPELRSSGGIHLPPFLLAFSTMHTVSLTHGEVFLARLLGALTTTNGIVAAKLSKTRSVLANELKAVAEGFDVIAKKHATKDEAGAPVPLVLPAVAEVEASEGKPAVAAPPAQPQFYQLTGTPAYVMTDEAKAAFDAETAAYHATKVDVAVPELTHDDVRAIIFAGPNGMAMPIPPQVADVLALFAPPL